MVNSSEQVTADTEEAEHKTMHREKPLRVRGGFEPAHLSHALSRRLVRDLRPIVGIRTKTIGNIRRVAPPRTQSWRGYRRLFLASQLGYSLRCLRYSRSVVRFYNKRGTAEQWIKEGNQATHWTRLSCHRFRANEVRLQLSVLACNLGNLWRRLVLPPRITRWSLTSLQQRLVKSGGRLVKHARYYWLLPAEGHLNRRLFGDMLQRIWALPAPAG